MPEVQRHKSAELRNFRKAQLDSKRRKVGSVTRARKQPTVAHECSNDNTLRTPTYPTPSGAICFVSINVMNF